MNKLFPRTACLFVGACLFGLIGCASEDAMAGEGASSDPGRVSPAATSTEGPAWNGTVGSNSRLQTSSEAGEALSGPVTDGNSALREVPQ